MLVLIKIICLHWWAFNLAREPLWEGRV